MRILIAVEGGEEPCEPEAQLLERAELLLDPAERPLHGVADPVLAVQQRPVSSSGNPSSRSARGEQPLDVGRL